MCVPWQRAAVLSIDKRIGLSIAAGCASVGPFIVGRQVSRDRAPLSEDEESSAITLQGGMPESCSRVSGIWLGEGCVCLCGPLNGSHLAHIYDKLSTTAYLGMRHFPFRWK
jgi:hypothetical protein